MTATPPNPLEMDNGFPEPSDDGLAGDELLARDGWPVPRGPHLPDALGVLPVAAWLFILLAVARFAWGLREASVASAIDPWRIGQVVLFGMPSVVSILLPAALLARHRDAPSRAPALVVGVVLLAAVEGLRVLAGPLQPFFEWLTPGDESVVFLVPSALVYQVALNLAGAVAVAAIGLGLSRARRFADRTRSWPVSAVLAVLVVSIAFSGIVSVSRLSSEQLPMTLTVVVYVVSTVVLNVISAAAFGYLTASLTAGARADENPVLGWRLGGAGAWLVIGSLASLGALGLVQATPDSAAFLNDVFVLIEGIFALGFLALLGGFVLGLPSLDAIEEDGEGGDDAFEREEDVDGNSTVGVAPSSATAR